MPRSVSAGESIRLGHHSMESSFPAQIRKSSARPSRAAGGREESQSKPNFPQYREETRNRRTSAIPSRARRNPKRIHGIARANSEGFQGQAQKGSDGEHTIFRIFAAAIAGLVFLSNFDETREAEVNVAAFAGICASKGAVSSVASLTRSAIYQIAATVRWDIEIEVPQGGIEVFWPGNRTTKARGVDKVRKT